MKLFFRMNLFTLVAAGFFFVSAENADAQLFGGGLFKCRKSACCEPEPEPEPVCCPEPAPEPVCCPEPAPEPVCCPEPAPAPEPVCCPEPEPAPEPVCCPEPAPAPEPVCCPEPAPCCCGAMEAAAAEPAPVAQEPSPYGAPELAEGEVLISISPIEVPTDASQTVTSAE